MFVNVRVLTVACRCRLQLELDAANKERKDLQDQVTTSSTELNELRERAAYLDRTQREAKVGSNARGCERWAI